MDKQGEMVYLGDKTVDLKKYNEYTSIGVGRYDGTDKLCGLYKKQGEKHLVLSLEEVEQKEVIVYKGKEGFYRVKKGTMKGTQT